jgi:hypothetical protein
MPDEFRNPVTLTEAVGPAIRRIMVSPWLADSKTHGAVDRCRRQTLRDVKRLFWGLRYF